MRLLSDPAIREALYGLYVALFEARRKCPDHFEDQRLTNIQTAIMGIKNYGWRVVGITREALDLLATDDFRKDKFGKRLRRGHIVDRIETARTLFKDTQPKSLEDFFATFLQNDRTVIMLTEQNQRNKPLLDYIGIDNPDGDLFSNGAVAGWRHGKVERDYLRKLHLRLALTP